MKKSKSLWAGKVKTAVLSLLILVSLCTGCSLFNPGGNELYFSCSEDNDLYRVMTSSGKEYPRFTDPEAAVEAALPGSGVLILADEYPQTPTQISPAVYEKSKLKKLRLFVEYPSHLPGMTIGEPQTALWERAVVATSTFEPGLERFRILQIHACNTLPIQSNSVSLKPADLVLARVAGYNSAVYGLPETTIPLLSQVEGKDILVSTTKLSQFVTARYAPNSAWTPIWNHVLAWLSPSQELTLPDWTPSVRPSFTREEKLPDDAEQLALQRGLKWYGGFLLDEPWLEKSDKINWKQIGGSPVVPPNKSGEPTGDGRFGILEGHVSVIQADGSQPIRNLPRGDCNAESAMTYALGSITENNDEYARISTNLMEYVYNTSGMYQGPPNKPTDGWYGLLGWYEPGGKYGSEHGADNYWGNDGSKALVSTMVTAAALDTDRWDDPLVAGILGNFRTAGPQGFRNGSPVNKAGLKQNGWEFYARRRGITPWPQREGWIWATYLWLYDKTQYEPLLVQARKALELTMDNYPKYWRCSLYEMQMERGRILLPLAWLVRVDDTPEHRRWLYQIVDDMTARMDASGAIQEELIATSMTSNEDYGTNETSILHRDGDPCVDVFYSFAPAYVGMHEAAAATGDKRLAELADRMTEFLVRIQLRSEDHKDLDGGWVRAFDYDNWEHWGGNGDTGWGAWCSETGWLQSHVVSTLAARKLKTSLWEMTLNSKAAVHFPRYRREMEIDKAVEIWNDSPPLELRYVGFGQIPQLSHAPDRLYPGIGAAGLMDGRFGSPDPIDLRWCGFSENSFEATVKLDGSRLVRYIGARFMHDPAKGIYFPQRLEALAFKGDDFHVVGVLDIKQPEDQKTPVAQEFGIDLTDCETPQIRLRVVGRKVLQENHPAAKGILLDELILKPFAINTN